MPWLIICPELRKVSLLNLAEGTRQRATPTRLRNADYAIGSSLECAGCLDLARIKTLLSRDSCQVEKALLCEITKMLIGLRKAWTQSTVREEAPTYGECLRPEQLFHHEKLDVYTAALGFMEWFVSQPEANELSHRLFRQIDDAGTSVVLNIAEGNGRFAELDHYRFLQIAQSSSVKAAAYLDLVVEKGLLAEKKADKGRKFCDGLARWLWGFRRCDEDFRQSLRQSGRTKKG